MGRANDCRLYVGRISHRTRERDLDRLFAPFGKIREILLKAGFAFVEFDDPRDAEDACYELNGKELLGDRILVEMAKGTERGRGGLPMRNDTSSRDRSWMDKYGPFKRTDYRVIIENLSTRVSWQDLKDLMRKVGCEVCYADAHHYRKNEAVVEFASRSDMKRAIEKYDGHEVNGRRMALREDRRSESPSRSRSRSRRPSRKRSSSKKKNMKRGNNRRSRSRSRTSRHSYSPEVKRRRSSRSRSRSEMRSERNGNERLNSHGRTPSTELHRSHSPTELKGTSLPSRDRSPERKNRNSKERSGSVSRSRSKSKSRSREGSPARRSTVKSHSRERTEESKRRSRSSTHSSRGGSPFGRSRSPSRGGSEKSGTRVATADIPDHCGD